MMGRTHALIGVSTVWAISVLPHAIDGLQLSGNTGILAMVAGISALVPDLDAQRSLLSSWTVAGIRPLEPLAWITNRTLGHRGALHSAVGVCIITLAALGVGFATGWQIGLAVWLGYVSHLAGDACTVSGIPLWPGRSKRIYLLPLRFRLLTGSDAETALVPLFAIADITLLIVNIHLAAVPLAFVMSHLST